MSLRYILAVLNCRCCNDLPRKPVILPCGNTVCGSHAREAKWQAQDGRISCPACPDKHIIPVDGNFINNQLAESLIDLRLHELDLSRLAARCEAEKATRSLADKLCTFDMMTTAPALFLSQCADAIVNEIDVWREDFVSKLDAHCNELIGEVRDYEGRCAHAARGILTTFPRAQIDAARVELNHLETLLRALVIDEDMWQKVRTEAEKTTPNVTDSIELLKNMLLLNMECTFDPNAPATKNGKNSLIK